MAFSLQGTTSRDDSMRPPSMKMTHRLCWAAPLLGHSISALKKWTHWCLWEELHFLQPPPMSSYLPLSINLGQIWIAADILLFFHHLLQQEDKKYEYHSVQACSYSHCHMQHNTTLVDIVHSKLLGRNCHVERAILVIWTGDLFVTGTLHTVMLYVLLILCAHSPTRQQLVAFN